MNPRLFAIVIAISMGVALASYGELNFVMSGFVCQTLGIAFEAARLVSIQKLLTGLKMSPLVSLYYFAPVSTSRASSRLEVPYLAFFKCTGLRWVEHSHYSFLRGGCSFPSCSHSSRASHPTPQCQYRTVLEHRCCIPHWFEFRTCSYPLR